MWKTDQAGSPRWCYWVTGTALRSNWDSSHFSSFALWLDDTNRELHHTPLSYIWVSTIAMESRSQTRTSKLNQSQPSLFIILLQGQKADQHRLNKIIFSLLFPLKSNQKNQNWKWLHKIIKKTYKIYAKKIFQMHSNQNKVSIPSYTNFTLKVRIHFSQNKKTDQMSLWWKWYALGAWKATELVRNSPMKNILFLHQGNSR